MAPYFNLAIGAGRSAAATLMVSNLGARTEKLKIGRSAGITATNGGSAYRQVPRGCSGPGCWVTGLPQFVTLPPHTREELNFTVRVPAGLPPGQYLGGISAGLPARPRSVRVGSRGTASVRALLLERVTVGVAVTVGRLPRLATRLRIPAVQGAVEGPMARLNIELDNTGRTFARGQGRASCTAAGKRHSYPAFADTVLPGGHALVPVNAPGLPEGATLPCQIWLRYGHHQTVRWAGQVTVPAAPGSRIAHTGNGAYSVIPKGGVPVWAVVLIGVGVLALAGVGVLLFRLRGAR